MAESKKAFGLSAGDRRTLLIGAGVGFLLWPISLALASEVHPVIYPIINWPATLLASILPESAGSENFVFVTTPVLNMIAYGVLGLFIKIQSE